LKACFAKWDRQLNVTAGLWYILTFQKWVGENVFGFLSSIPVSFVFFGFFSPSLSILLKKFGRKKKKYRSRNSTEGREEEPPKSNVDEEEDEEEDDEDVSKYKLDSDEVFIRQIFIKILTCYVFM